MPPEVLIREVGPRDGLQSLARTLPTPDKLRWIAAMAAAGVREIEVASLVPPRLLPQMADAEAVLHEARQIDALRCVALAPNLKGARRAIDAGAQVIVLPVSASVLHSRANLRCTPAEAIGEVARVCALRDVQAAGARPVIEVGLATAFGCTLQGAVDESDVLRLAVAAADAGCDQINLADTTGHANPAQVRRLVALVQREVGARLRGLHLHDTRGLALANATAALDAGIRAFDASLGGLGGCPYAPGAGGNAVTEDLVFMLQSMGIDCGIDLDALLAARALLATVVDEPLRGHVAIAGLPRMTLSDCH